MRILDFLCYYLNSIYIKRKQNLFFNSPLSRTIYSITMVTLFWLFSLYQIIIFCFDNNLYAYPALIPTLIAFILFSQLYKYIYQTRNRYKFITSPSYPSFKISNSAGVSIVVIFIMSSLILPFLIALLISLKQRGRI
jgi:hypothetical protein